MMRNHTDKASKTFQGMLNYLSLSVYKFLKLIISVKHYDRGRKRASTAKPLHVRRVEKALDMKPFLNSWERYQIISSSDSDDEDIPDLNDVNIESILRGI